MTSPPGGGLPGRRPPPKSGRQENRSTGRGELSRHARFAEVSPAVGVLDQRAMERALAADPAAFELLAAMTTATDERLRLAAIQLAAAIVLDRARAARPSARGVSRLRLVRGGVDGDLDVDASLDDIAAARASGQVAGLDELTVAQWAKAPTAFAVVVDRSGSMSGARLGAAALVAAACALRAPREHAVLTFAGTVDVIRPLVSDVPAGVVVSRLLGLRGHVTTALGAALRSAAAALADARASRRVVILLSDCRGTSSGDGAIEAARALSELIILAPADDCEQAVEFARQTGARCAPIAHPLDAATALDHLLAPGGAV